MPSPRTLSGAMLPKSSSSEPRNSSTSAGSQSKLLVASTTGPYRSTGPSGPSARTPTTRPSPSASSSVTGVDSTNSIAVLLQSAGQEPGHQPGAERQRVAVGSLAGVAWSAAGPR